MDISLIKPDQLTETQIAQWRSLAAADPAYDSPFFTPVFTMAVGQARPDVEIAIVNKGNRHVAFFPFQRASRRTARPVGWKLNDFQGAVLAPGERIDAVQLLRACQLSKWRFDHLPTSQSWCRDAHMNPAASPAMDISSGFEAYVAMKLANGGTRIKTINRHGRKLHRDIGPLRFEFDTKETSVFDTLLRWKTEQLERTKQSNIFSQSWARNSLEILRHSTDSGCRGTLSALYSGNSLVAAHFGIRSERTMHWWLTAYNREFERYSPGLLLLLQLAQACATEGIQRIDLGKGSEPYKQYLMTSAIPLAEGSVASTRWRRTHERIAYCTTHSIRTSPWMYRTWKWMKHVGRHLATK